MTPQPSLAPSRRCPEPSLMSDLVPDFTGPGFSRYPQNSWPQRLSSSLLPGLLKASGVPPGNEPPQLWSSWGGDSCDPFHHPQTQGLQQQHRDGSACSWVSEQVSFQQQKPRMHQGKWRRPRCWERRAPGREAAVLGEGSGGPALTSWKPPGEGPWKAILEKGQGHIPGCPS